MLISCAYITIAVINRTLRRTKMSFPHNPHLEFAAILLMTISGLMDGVALFQIKRLISPFGLISRGLLGCIVAVLYLISGGSLLGTVVWAMLGLTKFVAYLAIYAKLFYFKKPIIYQISDQETLIEL